MKNSSILTLILILSFMIITKLNAAEISYKVNHDEAEKLASEAYDNSYRYIKYMDDIKDWPTSPPFYLLTIGETDTFAVNPWTGDVWNSWECKKMHTPTLGKSQAKIRQRFSKEEMISYPKLSIMKPYFMGFCDPNSMR